MVVPGFHLPVMSRSLCSERIDRKEVRYMRKKIVIGALFPLVASLSLWLAMGSASATHATRTAPVHRQRTVHTLSAKASTASENQSGTESEKQGGTESEKQGREEEGAADAPAEHPD